MGGDLNHFKIISKIYTERGWDVPQGTCLTCKTVYLLITAKNI